MSKHSRCMSCGVQWRFQVSYVVSTFTSRMISMRPFSSANVSCSCEDPACMPCFRMAAATVPWAAQVQMRTPRHAMWTDPSANLHHVPALTSACCHSRLDTTSCDGCFWSVQIASTISEQVSWLCAVLKNSSSRSTRAHVEMRASSSRECEKRQIRARFC